MSYQAIVTPIHTRPHPNADRLQIGTAAGNTVVVGMDTKDGELGVFFGPDGQLSHDFCMANGLYNAAALAELGFPVAEGEKLGFFSANRRVRSQNFRGVKSDGFWVPLSYFSYLAERLDIGATLALTESGHQFTEVGGNPVCEKYYTPATRRAMANGQVKQRKENKMFPKHADTSQLRFLTEIPHDSVVYITEKLHGTSGRYGRVLEDVPLPKWKCIINNLCVEYLRRMPFPQEQEWVYLNGSRNVTLEKVEGPGFYGTNEFRYNVVRDLALRKGEILFFEIVGYVAGESLIMPAQDTTKLKDKAIEKLYGKRMTYTYGCQPGEHKMYVYKILQTDEDGNALELSWTQMLQRCTELGLNTVPLVSSIAWSRETAPVKELAESLMSGPSRLDARHMREGVVLRIESSQGIQHVKSKSFEFGVLEGYIKEADNYVDTEEVA
jgi:hypothetical protein